MLAVALFQNCIPPPAMGPHMCRIDMPHRYHIDAALRIGRVSLPYSITRTPMARIWLPKQDCFVVLRCLGNCLHIPCTPS